MSPKAFYPSINVMNLLLLSCLTEPGLREVLTKIGLEDEYDTKLKISHILQIIQCDTSEINIETTESLTEA